MKLLFYSKDEGDYIRILTPDTSGREEKLDDSYEVFTVAIYQYICRQLNDNKIVCILKTANPLYLKVEDIIVKDTVDNLDMEKEKTVHLINEMISVKDFSRQYLSPMFDFVTSAMRLFSKGYYITDDNEEEMHFKILNSKVPADIDAYKKYTASKKLLSSEMTNFAELNALAEKVRTFDDIKDVKMCYNKIISEMISSRS